MAYILYYVFLYLILFIKIIQSSFPIPNASTIIPDECKTNCDVEFGKMIGKIGNVPSYSNCNNNCTNFIDGGVIFLNNETYFGKDIFTGIRWQCVEYARRWLVVNKNSTFANIDSAFQIYTLDSVQDLIQEGVQKPFISIDNGDNRAPEVNDLIIYPFIEKEAPHGHVAVIADLNLDKGYVDIAEQNYENFWVNENYSRRVVLLKCEQGNTYSNLVNYTLTEINWTPEYINDLTGKQLKELCIKEKSKVIGFKRIIDKNIETSSGFSLVWLTVIIIALVFIVFYIYREVKKEKSEEDNKPFFS